MREEFMDPHQPLDLGPPFPLLFRPFNQLRKLSTNRMCDTLTAAIFQSARQSDGTRRQRERTAARSLQAFRGLQRPGQRAQTGSTRGEEEEVRELICLHGNWDVDTAITPSSQAAIKKHRQFKDALECKPTHFHPLLRVPISMS